MQWFDEASGEGRILHAGRRFAVRTAAAETSARVPGARVHFDIDSGAGGAVAVNVRLLPGTRVSRRQRRFGDLTGSATADSKGTAPFAQAHPEMGHDLQRHPMRVAQLWSDLLTAGDLDGAMLLYAPDAVLHAGGDVVVGPTAIRRRLVASSLPGRSEPGFIRGEDGSIVVRWEHTAPDGESLEGHLRVAHGEIAEQWLGASWMTVGVEAGAAPVELSAAGQISESDRAYALEKIGKVLHTISDPVLHASIRLVHAADPAREQPALARATIDVNGEPVRAHVAAPTATEAVDLLEARLRHRLEHLAEHQRALRRRGPSSPAGEWRHGDLPTHRPPYHPRPVDERKVVRHKTFTTEAATVDEAVFDLEAMDYDFFLFTELAGGDDALVDRREGGSYGLRYLHGLTDETGPPAGAAVESVPQPAPELSLDQAREHLDIGHEPWVFFKDAGSRRGHVLYRRYDGHYGLITPVTEVLE